MIDTNIFTEFNIMNITSKLKQPAAIMSTILLLSFAAIMGFLFNSLMVTIAILAVLPITLVLRYCYLTVIYNSFNPKKHKPYYKL